MLVKHLLLQLINDPDSFLMNFYDASQGGCTAGPDHLIYHLLGFVSDMVNSRDSKKALFSINSCIRTQDRHVINHVTNSSNAHQALDL